MAHEAPAEPKTRGGVHTDPPEEALEHTKCTRRAKVVRSHGMTGVEGPMAHDHRYVDADGVVEAGRNGSRVPDGVDVRVSHEQGNVVVGDVQFAFSSKG